LTKLVVAKFGGSAIGADGLSIPIIIQRINSLKKDAKVLAVFSAPLTIQNGKTKSLTDLVLELGNKAEKGEDTNLQEVKNAYEKILELVSSEYSGDCKMTIDSFLEKSQKALGEAKQKREFAEEVRSRALAYSGEILMSHVINYILKSQGIKSEAVEMETWPIITDNNIESTNFLVSESSQRVGDLENLWNEKYILGFDSLATITYNRGVITLIGDDSDTRKFVDSMLLSVMIGQVSISTASDFIPWLFKM